MKSVTVEAVTKTDGFSILEKEWKDLARNCRFDNVFLTWEWMSSWWNSFSEGRQLWILTARAMGNGELVGLAPLNIRRRFMRKMAPYRELSFLENQRAAPDHLDILCRIDFEQEVATAFADFIMAKRSAWDIIRLNHVNAESLFLSLVLQKKPPGSVSLPQPCPYISLPGRWEDFLAGLNKNARHNILRYGNRLKKDYPDQVNYPKIEREEDLSAAIDTFASLHLDRKSEQKMASTLSDPLQLDFLREITKKFNDNQWLHFYFLKVKEQPIAAIICFFYRGIFSFYQQGHDPAWAVYSPGRQITAYAVRTAIMEGAQEFDFLRGDEAYKYTWTNHSHVDIELIMPTSRWGRLLLQLRMILQSMN